MTLSFTSASAQVEHAEACELLGYRVVGAPPDNAAPSVSVADLLVTAPDAPAITSVVPGDGRVTVAFDPPADDGGRPVTSVLVQVLTGDQRACDISGPQSSSWSLLHQATVKKAGT